LSLEKFLERKHLPAGREELSWKGIPGGTGITSVERCQKRCQRSNVTRNLASGPISVEESDHGKGKRWVELCLQEEVQFFPQGIVGPEALESPNEIVGSLVALKVDH